MLALVAAYQVRERLLMVVQYIVIMLIVRQVGYVIDLFWQTWN